MKLLDLKVTNKNPRDVPIGTSQGTELIHPGDYLRAINRTQTHTEGLAGVVGL